MKVKMIERSKALKYIEEVLDIPDADGKSKDLGLLNDIMRAMQSEVPYNNVWMLKRPHVPTQEEIIKEGLERRGGLCLHMNYFLLELLRAIDYDVYLVAANYGTSPFPEAHMICIVRGLGKSDHKHLVDIGSGYPMFEAAPMHDLPKTYAQTALRVKYTRSETTGMFYRWHRKRDSVMVKDEFQDITEGQWIQIFSFFDKEVNFRHFKKTAHPVFTSFHPQNKLQTNLYLTRFPGRKNAATCILGMKLLITDDNGFLSMRILSLDEIVSAAEKYFPEIAGDDVATAVQKVKQHLQNDRTNSLCGMVRMAAEYVWYTLRAFCEK